MMRKLIGLVLIVVALLGLKELHQYWEQVKARSQAGDQKILPSAAPQLPPGVLPGLPPSLEPSLQEARSQSPIALKLWIEKHRPYVRDPRLADIELDYVVLIGGRSYLEAKEIFNHVRDRTPTNSPVYPRIRQLEKNFR